MNATHHRQNRRLSGTNFEQLAKAPIIMVSLMLLGALSCVMTPTASHNFYFMLAKHAYGKVAHFFERWLLAVH